MGRFENAVWLWLWGSFLLRGGEFVLGCRGWYVERALGVVVVKEKGLESDVDGKIGLESVWRGWWDVWRGEEGRVGEDERGEGV